MLAVVQMYICRMESIIVIYQVQLIVVAINAMQRLHSGCYRAVNQHFCHVESTQNTHRSGRYSHPTKLRPMLATFTEPGPGLDRIRWETWLGLRINQSFPIYFRRGQRLATPGGKNIS